MLELFDKLLDKCRRIAIFFTKLKVFYQILIIIALLIVFLGIQGYTSIKIINNMQDTTETAFNDNNNKLKENFTLKQNLKQISILYLEICLNPSMEKANSFGNLAQIDEIESKISFAQGLDEPSKKEIIRKLDFVKTIVTMPVNIDNYELLQKELKDINSHLDKASILISHSVINNIHHGYIFAVQSKRTTAIIMIISALLSIAIGMIIAKSLSKPLIKMIDATKLLAVGDLSRNVSISGCPEVSLAAKELNKAIVDLREMVRSINEQSDYLYSASKELKAASNENGHSAAEVATTMDELAKASSEQVTQINQAVETNQLLSEFVQRVSTDVQSITFASEKVAQSAKLGQQAAFDVTNEIDMLFNYTKEMSQVINTLDESSEEISQIISVIEGIAEQTTLLALNASIEAARAGDYGKGFSVVAKETGKLADQSKQAVKLISDLIATMRTRSSRAVEIMQNGVQRAESGKKLINETNIIFETIFQTLTNILNQIDLVAQSTKQMTIRNGNMTEAISAIAAISEENMANTQEVSAIAEEQSASVEEVMAQAESLAQIAENLRHFMAIFKLEHSN
jgi:methyl-accepting chemotaxis protein